MLENHITQARANQVNLPRWCVHSHRCDGHLNFINGVLLQSRQWWHLDGYIEIAHSWSLKVQWCHHPRLLAEVARAASSEASAVRCCCQLWHWCIAASILAMCTVHLISGKWSVVEGDIGWCVAVRRVLGDIGEMHVRVKVPIHTIHSQGQAHPRYKSNAAAFSSFDCQRPIS